MSRWVFMHNVTDLAPSTARSEKPRSRLVRTLGQRVVGDLGPRERRLLAGAVVAMTVSAVLKAIMPLLLGVAIDEMLASGGARRAAPIGPLLLVGASLFAGQGLDVVRRQLVENVSTAFECNNRIRAYSRLLRLPLAELGDAEVGALQGNANRSVEGSAKLLKLLTMDLLPALVGSGVAVLVVLGKDWRVGLVMLMVIPTGFLLTRWQVVNQAGVRVRIRSIKDEIDGRVGGQLPMVEAIRGAGAEDHFSAQSAEACRELRATEYSHHRAMALFDAAKSANEGLWQMLSLGVAVYAAGAGVGAVGNVTAYALLYTSILGPLREMHRIVDEASESAQQAQDFYALMDAAVDPGYVAPAGGPALCADAGDAVVAFRGVSFAHAGSANPVLNGLDLSIAAGERVGLVGASACGKSTILRLLRRMHHGYRGEIALGGLRLETLTHEDLSRRVAYVTQESQLARATIEENIRFGDSGASFEEVVDAARRAHVHDDVMRLSGGYATMVSERGANLSGGQRQRICIARSLLRRPELLLLDEPTSALDQPSERSVQRAIDSLAGVTTMIVAHRLETLRTVDRILVVDGGRIVEGGSYDELARRNGRFARMLAGEGSTAELEPATVA